MFGHNWYFGLTRKYVSYFGTIFNDIHIDRSVDGNPTPSQYLKVPLSYAPKKKVLVRPAQDPNIDRQYSIQLPRMSFEITGLNYDGERNLPNLNRYSSIDVDNANKLNYIYVPAPYDISFNLYIYVKNTEDGTKIFEQILPFFKPEWTASLQLIPEYGITMDVPIILNTNAIEDAYDGNFLQRQVLTYTFSFTMKAWYFGPPYSKPIIKFANTNFYVPPSSEDLESAVDNTDMIGSIRVTPGLDANGNPTSNSSLSIDANEIYATDDFGFIIENHGITLVES